MKWLYQFFLITCAGLPAQTQLSGTLFITTLPAPIVTLFPIVILPIIVTLAPRVTLSPIIGLLSFVPLFPSVVKCRNEKFLPIDSAFRIVAYGCAKRTPPPIVVVLEIIKSLNPGLHQEIKKDQMAPIRW